MKKRLAVLFVALVSCVFVAALTKPAWADDAGSRYSDAFILIQQGQTAEGQSDHATAYHKYHEALDILHAIRTDWPGWNSQMVEFRLRDCQSRFDAVKAKLPGGVPPLAGTEAPLVVTPAVTVSPEQPAPQPLAVATPPPVVKAAANDQSVKLRAQLDKLQKENDQLKSDLVETRRTANSNPQVDKLTRENKDLKDQLAAAEKKAAAPPPAPAESAEMKKLRTDLDKAHADADAARKSASQVPELQKQNKDLSAQLAAARKEASAKVTPVVAAPAPDPAELKKLRAEADGARADAEKARKTAADLQKSNADLNAQITTAKKQAADAADARSAELKKLRGDLDAARANAEQARKSANEAATLEKQNKDLSAQLEAARKEASVKATPPVAAPAADAAELKKLQADADSARADAEKARKQVADLEKQNVDLSSKLAAEKNATVAATAAEPADARVMKHLRNENSYLRNLLDTYAASNPELRGQLRHHDQNQAKTSP
jgi:predicted  nucleic acid-binding Zn-ribbon protein